MVSAPVVLAACLGVPSQIARTARLPDHHASIARNGCEPARIPVFCPCCRAEHQRRRVWPGQERGPRRRRRRRRRPRPVGGPSRLVGGVDVHWPARQLALHGLSLPSSVPAGQMDGVVCPFRAARRRGGTEAMATDVVAWQRVERPVGSLDPTRAACQHARKKKPLWRFLTKFFLFVIRTQLDVSFRLH